MREMRALIGFVFGLAAKDVVDSTLKSTSSTVIQMLYSFEIRQARKKGIAVNTSHKHKTRRLLKWH